MHSSNTHSDSENPTADTPHHKSNVRVFVIVFIMLIGLTALSFWIANSHLMDNRPLAWGAMMAVSVAKAMLVVMFFMHLWWERAWKYVLTIPALIMGCLLVMLLVPDVAMRTETYSQQRQSNAPESQTVGVDGPKASAR